ncbi:MAG: hypothetical protein M3Y18_02145 [Candidatus Eremiobacteraeota bacterium]|nr:hypothetical protein [Candidatus Eremiobacteraeota bacterium]
MTPRTRRAWEIGVTIFFVVMCGLIAYGQWYAVHVNVPKYHRQNAH